MVKFLSLILMSLAISTGLFAQLVDVESQRLRNDTTRLAGMLGGLYSYKQTNDVKLTEFESSLTFQLRSKNRKDIFLILGSYEVLKTSDESFTNNGFGHIRYTHKFNSLLRMEVFSQYQSNQKLLLKNRVLGGAGPRFRFFNRKNADATFGCLYMAEWEEIVGLALQAKLYHRMSAYLSLNFVIKEDFCEIISITYYQPLLTSFADYRLNNNTVLKIRLFKDLDFETGVKISFDSNPIVGVISNTFATTMGVKYKF